MIVFVIFFTRESSFLSGHQQSLLVQILSAKCQVCSIENKAGRGPCWSSSLTVIRIFSQMICLAWVVLTNFPTFWGWKGSEQLCNLKLAKHWHRVHMGHRKPGNLWNSIVLFSRPGKYWNFLVSDPCIQSRVIFWPMYTVDCKSRVIFLTHFILKNFDLVFTAFFGSFCY